MNYVQKEEDDGLSRKTFFHDEEADGIVGKHFQEKESDGLVRGELVQ